MSDSTFDVSKNYKRICYKEDRDLLNTELNEMQDVASHDRTMLFDRILTAGAILSGLDVSVIGSDIIIVDGFVYIDGCAVQVPGATFSFNEPGEHTIYVDVFRRDVTASEDPTLVNPLTGEPTAEREKWIATLQARDTSDDPLPIGAKSRSVAPVYIFNRDTGEIKPAAGEAGDTGSIVSAFANHAGHGGLDRHPAVTEELAGFMTPDQVNQIANHEPRLGSAEADLSDLSGSLNTHKSSSDHDSRYYTKTASDGRFAPIAHVGSGGTAHSVATTSQNGFMGSADKTQLNSHETRIVSIETALPGKADDVDVTAVQNALDTHKTSSDHDSKYYTKTASDGRFAAIAHVGSGGTAHSVATTSQNGFMASADKTQLNGHETRLTAVETTLPGKADDADVTAVQTALNTHKSSSDHDSRYYTESESNSRFAPIAHVGAGGSAHARATASQAGFIPPEVYEFLSRLTFWNGRYDYGNDGSGTLPYSVISGRNGMIWKGRCDSNSTHIIQAAIRVVDTPITAEFEFYHMVGTVNMQTGTRIRLASPYTPPVPGGKAYLVDLYPDTFTNIVIDISGSGEVGFALRIFPGDESQICWDIDPDRAGKAIVV